MTLHILDPGLLTTVQDAGRAGLGRFGVPEGGAMDPVAFRAANLLVGNPEDAAVLEITLLGPELEIDADAVLAVVGGLEPRLERRGGPAARVPAGVAFRMGPGDRLLFGQAETGARACLAVRGGIDVPIVLGSRSTFLPGGWGGLEGRALRAGDRLPIGPVTGDLPLRFYPRGTLPAWSPAPVVRVIPGPQLESFSSGALEQLARTSWQVAPRSDRIGVRLHGPALELAGPADLPPEGLAPGSIQVPADGQPIVLTSDRPATGGYAKIATVITADLWRVAQARPGDTLRFVPVTVEAARAAWLELERLLREGWRTLD